MRALIDFHTHFFSYRFFQALAGQAPGVASDEEKMARVAEEAGIELPAFEVERHTERWIAEMDRYGVQHAVSIASVPEEAGTVARAVAAAEGRLFGFAVVDPKSPLAPQRAQALLGEKGLRGLVLFPALHRYRIDGPEVEEVAAAAEEHRAVVVVHCGLLRVALRERFGLPRAYDPALANPLSLVPLADRHPGLRFVIPHFGAGFFRETLMAGAQCPNVLVDTSSSNSWMATQPQKIALADVFERTLAVFGPERVLFGTDSSVFPRGWRHDVFAAQREALGACGIDEEDRLRVFFTNAAELLDLEPAAKASAAPRT